VGRLSEQEVARLEEKVKVLFDQVAEIKEDVKQLKDQLINRLPPWATILISLLAAAVGWFAKP